MRTGSSSTKNAAHLANAGAGSNKLHIVNIYENFTTKNSQRNNSAVPNQRNSNIKKKAAVFNENKNALKVPARSPSYSSHVVPNKAPKTPQKSKLDNFHEISSLKVIGDSDNSKVISFNALYSNNKKF